MRKDMQAPEVLSAQDSEQVRYIQNGTQRPHITADSKPVNMPRVYRVEDIAEILSISLRAAYNFCNTTKEFRVLHIGSSIRVSKESFDEWFAQSEQ